MWRMAVHRGKDMVEVDAGSALECVYPTVAICPAVLVSIAAENNWILLHILSAVPRSIMLLSPGENGEMKNQTRGPLSLQNCNS